jgi:hypothetical protein
VNEISIDSLIQISHLIPSLISLIILNTKNHSIHKILVYLQINMIIPRRSLPQIIKTSYHLQEESISIIISITFKTRKHKSKELRVNNMLIELDHRVLVIDKIIEHYLMWEGLYSWAIMNAWRRVGIKKILLLSHNLNRKALITAL